MTDRTIGGNRKTGQKRQMLVYLPAETITALKIAGIEDALSVSMIIEETANAWLRRRKARLDRKATSGRGRSENED